MAELSRAGNRIRRALSRPIALHSSGTAARCTPVGAILHFSAGSAQAFITMKRYMNAVSCTRLLAVLWAISSAVAQDAPGVRTGNVEIGGFAGWSIGVDKVRVMGGGNVAFAASQVIMPYFEYSYFPGFIRTDSVSIPGRGTANFSYELPLSDVHGGVHFRLMRPGSRFVPYGVLGAGVIHSPSRNERVTVPGLTTPVDVPVASRNDFAVNFGGGIRWYVNEVFGFRFEVKGYKPSGQFSNVFGKSVFGIFLQLH